MELVSLRSARAANWVVSTRIKPRKKGNVMLFLDCSVVTVRYLAQLAGLGIYNSEIVLVFGVVIGVIPPGEVVAIADRQIFWRMIWVSATRQTFDHRVEVRAEEERNGIAMSAGGR